MQTAPRQHGVLCAVCQGALRSCDLASITELKGVDAPHHQSCTTFLRSVNESCYICNRLWAGLTAEERRLAYDQSNDGEPYLRGDGALEGGTTTTKPLSSMDKIAFTRLRLSGGSYRGHEHYNISLDVSGEPCGVGARSLSFLMERRSDQGFQQYEREVLAPDTKAAIPRSPAINWVENCLANHPKCNILREQKSWYPTRLLDCGDPEDPSTQCHLIESRRTSIMRGPYMTLSHRWGPNPTDYLRLTSENYRQLSNGIGVEMLPQLYRDAIYVVRQLGLRYLWIDSLCIIQQGDDHADLERELPQMSEIYSHSFCNISAAEALDDHHSLFHSRDPRSISPAMVNLPTSSHAGPFLVSYLDLWETDVSRSLINSRAWVLQERLLSPRVIHFGPKQLFWECCTKDAAEIYPDGMPPQIHSRRRRIKNLAPNCLVGVEAGSDKKGAYMSWARIVEAYTACSLTCAGDKLVALSGIAKPFRSILEDKYVAGMWRRYLEHELLWVIANTGFGPDAPVAPEIPYRAPSWSWAAVDATVAAGDLDVRDSSILIHVEEVQLQHGSEDDTGHVRGGWLKLSGVLKRLVLLSRPSPTSSLSRGWELVVNGTPVTRALGESAIPEEQAEVDLEVYLDRPRPTNYLGSSGEQNVSEGLYCMPARVDDWSYGTIRILLLEVVDAERGVFRRIGMAHAWGTGMKAKILGQGVYMDEDKFPCERYHDGRHTIVIV